MKRGHLRLNQALLLACCLLAAAPRLASGAQQDQQPRIQGLAVTYPEGETVTVILRGTARLLGAAGEAKVVRRAGITEIDIKLDRMKPALLFGGDFSTFVVWTIAPEGIVFNAGELVLRGAKSELKATTPLVTFGIFVTAEPHCLVDRPSSFFVLVNTEDGLAGKKGVATSRFDYDKIRTGYEYQLDNLTASSLSAGTLRTDRYQALLAVALARKAGAGRYAPEQFMQAQAALDETQRGFTQGMTEKELTALAQRAVRMAVASRELAEERAAQEALEAERRAAKEEAAQLSRARAAAEAAASRAREEAERAREAVRKAQSESKEAEERMLKANLEADRLARQKLEADKRAETAQQRTAVLYLRLKDALGRIAETRETERGLVVNLPDSLFDPGRVTLRPRGREILSGIAGILLVAPEYRLSIEGHSDSVGRKEVNQRLSEERALSVADYLAAAQVSTSAMTARGLGESQPVASNLTPGGRRQNRRVELIIEGLTASGR